MTQPDYETMCREELLEIVKAQHSASTPHPDSIAAMLAADPKTARRMARRQAWPMFAVVFGIFALVGLYVLTVGFLI